MRTLYVVTAEGLETFVAWGITGVEEALRDLFDAQILDFAPDRSGDFKIKALDSFGTLPELTAEPQTKIYGEQKND